MISLPYILLLSHTCPYFSFPVEVATLWAKSSIAALQCHKWIGHPWVWSLDLWAPISGLGEHCYQQEHSKRWLTFWREEPVLRSVSSTGSQWVGESTYPSQSSLRNRGSLAHGGKILLTGGTISCQRGKCRLMQASRKISGPPSTMGQGSTDLEERGLRIFLKRPD